MRIGLIDVDSHNYPNLPLMKLSAWHKQQGDHVEWYQPLLSGHMDIVYMSKVFTFTPDYEYYIDADKIVKGGTGYAIELIDEKEVYHKEQDIPLSEEIEHIYPDYSIYPEETKDTAYGFLTRGCPRGCSFCHVARKEGQCSHKVADLSELWNGQKHIELLDPNLLACPDWKELLQQIIDSKARVNFNQGLDIRMMTDEKAEMLSQIKLDAIHFAWVSPAYGMTVIGVTEEDIDDAPTVEAISKADYEARLKADMVAMLEKLQGEIEECVDGSEGSPKFEQGVDIARNQVIDIIQQKIDLLRSKN